MTRRITAALAGLLALAVPAAADTTVPGPVPPPEPPVLLLVEAQTGQRLLAKQPDLRFVPASVTKVMTVYLAFELMDEGKLSPEQRFTMRPEAWQSWHGRGTSMNLHSGESVRVDDLLHGITTISANDAAVVLAEGIAGSIAAWADLMNAEARKLGMPNSHFGTPNGWPDQGATYVTAADLAVLARALITRHEALYHRYFGHKAMTWNGVSGTSHDPVIGVVPGADGIKSGHTNEAGYNFLGSAERNGRRLLMVVGGARTEDARAKASRALLEWGFSAWESRPLFQPGALVGEARVQGGDTRHVGLVAPKGLPIALLRGGEVPKLTAELHYEGPLVAPFARGAQVGSLIVHARYRNGEQSLSVPLVTAGAVAKAGPLDRLWNGIMGVFS